MLVKLHELTSDTRATGVTNEMKTIRERSGFEVAMRRETSGFGEKVPRKRRMSVRAGIAAVAIAVLAAVGSVAPAYADNYPSWQDVQNAKANQATASAQVDKINGLISQLKSEVASTQAEAVKRGAELQVAEAKFDEANMKAQELEKQAAASQKKADDASTQAGKVAAQLYRTGGRNLTANLFLSGNGASGTNPDKLLSDLGSMSKLAEQSNRVYTDAKAAQNTANALSDQADVAKAERSKLQVAAQAAMQAAIEAAKAAQDKLAEQQKQIVVMQAQLAALTDATAKTVAGYEAGVAAA
ncbi:hypothetical protein N136_03907, partial [Leifsonia aquatica ATCC 14665]